MSADKRRSDRHRVRFKLVYDDGESFHAALVRDLSDSGVFLETTVPLPVGKRVVLSSLDIDDERAFDLPARVTRAVEGDGTGPDVPGMGLAFENLNDEQRVFLLSLIERLEEEESRYEGERDFYFGKTLPREGLRRSPSGVWRSPSRQSPSSDAAEAPQAAEGVEPLDSGETRDETDSGSALDTIVDGGAGALSPGADADPDHGANADPDHGANADPDHGANADPDHGANADPDNGGRMHEAGVRVPLDKSTELASSPLSDVQPSTDPRTGARPDSSPTEG